MTTLTQLKGLVQDLSEYAENHHDVDCTGDPPRFVSNAWGEVLHIVGGMEALIRQLERDAVAGAREAAGRGDGTGETEAAGSRGGDTPPALDPYADCNLPSWKSRRGIGE